MTRSYATSIVLVLVMLAGSAAFALGQRSRPAACLNKFRQKEWRMLVSALPERARTTLEQDEAVRAYQIENLRDLMAFACAAMKRGLARDAINSAELRFIRSEVIAIEYESKSGRPDSSERFGRITNIQVARFYRSPANLADFERFFKVKTEIMRRGDPGPASRKVTAEEIEQAKNFFAKIRISERSASRLGEPFRSTVEFKARLQQTQFLAHLFANAAAAEVAVSDAEVIEYIARHPELDVKARKIAATRILERAKKGDDFAGLANEFSQDPGNTGTDGGKKGGLYSDVSVGVMVPMFEKAALSLQAGQVYPDIVESDYGFHVIKLERKSDDGSKYDVRHVLVSTEFRDPDDPEAKGVPVAGYVRSKLESEREAAMIKRIVAEHAIVVEDYKPFVAPVKSRAVRKKR